MKKDFHPKDYRPMIIKDSNSGFAFLTRSTAKTDDTIKWEDGKEYPLLTVHISSASHPFYTGEEKIVDVEGRVDRFKARQAAGKEQKSKLAKKAKKIAHKQAIKPVREAKKVGGDIMSNAARPKKQSKKISKDKPPTKKEQPSTPPPAEPQPASSPPADSK